MFCALRDASASTPTWLLAVALLAATVPSRADVLPVLDLMREADHQRGLKGPFRFEATIFSADDVPPSGGDRVPTNATVVEVVSNGFNQQLVFVLQPTRGDVLLATPDAVWLRPRRLHRLTRIPGDLRMFAGASVSDVTSIDLIGNYEPILRPAADDEVEYVVDLRAGREGVRYPRACYRVRRADYRPARIELMAASGKPLKSITYAQFDVVLGHIIPTKLVVEDYIYKDTSIILMSNFQLTPDNKPSMFVPDYLLTLPDLTS